MIKALFTEMTRSVLSLVGVVLTTVSAILFVTLFATEEMGSVGSPYSGIIAFVIIPTVFVAGLVLMPIGLWQVRREDRRRAAAGQEKVRAPVIDLNVPHTRAIIAVVAMLTLVNIIIIASGTYKAVELMESTEFCGGTCHTVMSPEFSTHSRSAHARVRCTQCHIGPGANWFVKSKLSGSWQLVAVALDIYPRPIPTPVENLRPARETCEQCHWPTRFVGERLKIITRFEEDEANTEKKTVLMMKIGGAEAGKSRGIHWHVDPKNRVRYKADKRRQYVKEVESTLADGTTRLYTNQVPPAANTSISSEWRTMDCVDCHNRPTHVYQRAKDELDRGLSSGELDKSLPFIRREGLRVLNLPWKSYEEAEQGMKKELADFYGKEAPDAISEPKKLEQTVEALMAMYKRNVFPAMNVGWNTYPSFRDHEDDSGCYRCHTSDMKTADGKKVSQKCDLCHTTLAEKEENPEILTELSGE